VRVFGFLLLAALALVAADQVEVVAEHFEVDEKAGRTTFQGSVVITRGLDVMKADQIVVYATPDREVRLFEATGNTWFDITTEDNHNFRGRADELTYVPDTGLYTLVGNAWVEDVTNVREISGDEIVLNELTKVANVVGREKKPVKVIFTIQERQKEGADQNGSGS
jgi:lipopolysaccharide export system protein LptA